MSELDQIASLAVTIIFYVLVGGITIFSASALYLINKHGERQSVATATSIIYIVLFLIAVSSAFATL